MVSVLISVVGVTAFLACGAWLIYSQLRYGKTYRRIRGEDLPFLGESYDYYFAHPFRFFRDFFKNMSILGKAMDRRQPEPELEAARRPLLPIFLLLMLVPVIMFVLSVIFR